MKGHHMTSYDLSDAHTAPRYALTMFTVEEFQKFWPNLEEMLDQLPHTWRRWSKDSIYQSIVNDAMQVWGIGPPPKATFILFTSIAVHVTMKVLVVVWAAGTYEDDMLPLLDATFTNYARLNGCAEIEIRGREGWERKFKSIGFKREAVVLTRPVKNDRIN
jgi:hypothetical protein